MRNHQFQKNGDRMIVYNANLCMALLHFYRIRDTYDAIREILCLTFCSIPGIRCISIANNLFWCMQNCQNPSLSDIFITQEAPFAVCCQLFLRKAGSVLRYMWLFMFFLDQWHTSIHNYFQTCDFCGVYHIHDISKACYSNYKRTWVHHTYP